MKNIVFVIAVLFAWFVYDQMNEMDQIRRQSMFIAKVYDNRDKPLLLAMEELVFNEIQAGKWQIYYKSQYLNILWSLKKYQKIIDFFDKEKSGNDSIKHKFSFAICMARYKLNDNGKECAEELLNKIKQRSNYYDDPTYWEFVILADKQGEVEQDILKSKLDKEFIQLMLGVKKEDFIGNLDFD